MLRGRPYGSSGGFDFGNIVGDPFALATVSIALVREPSPVSPVAGISLPLPPPRSSSLIWLPYMHVLTINPKKF